jgi:hypothetical protein
MLPWDQAFDQRELRQPFVIRGFCGAPAHHKDKATARRNEIETQSVWCAPRNTRIEKANLRHRLT